MKEARYVMATPSMLLHPYGLLLCLPAVDCCAKSNRRGVANCIWRNYAIIIGIGVIELKEEANGKAIN